MVNKLKILTIAALISLPACSAVRSPDITEVKISDKHLSCQDILLEVNEAKFQRERAEANKGIGIRNIMSPLGYIPTYINAQESTSAADNRLAYLMKVYDIKGCAEKAAQAASSQAEPVRASAQYPQYAMPMPAPYFAYYPPPYGYPAPQR